MQFAGANYAPFERTPEQPWVHYTDEIVYFTNNPSLVRSFLRKFDDLWTSGQEFADYANITRPLRRSYSTYPIDPELNFPPDESYRDRALAAYATETQSVDVLMFRITDEQHSNAMIAALGRGVPVRLITDDTEYRNPLRLWHAYNVDKMYKAGAQVRVNAHQGINHEKAVLLRGAGLSIFGSSNWTSPSSDSQREHNLFTTKSWIYDWLEAQFTRKWTNGAGFTETRAFVPLPPDLPQPQTPAQGAAGVATSGARLSFYAGLWAHKYDIYFGTAQNPPLLEADKRLGPSQSDTDYRYYDLPPLRPNTTYYWKIVSKTMADLTAAGPVRSFSTGSTPPSNAPPTVTLTSPESGAVFAVGAAIAIGATASDADGSIARVDFYAGNVLVGSDATAPYAVSWSGAAAGVYTIDAVATDNNGAIAASNAATNRVGAGATPQPRMSIDIPAQGSTVAQPFGLSGWAIDSAVADGSNGVDVLHVWAYPAGGGPPVFAGWTPTGGRRDDVASLFGAQFGRSGYWLWVRGLASGDYTLAVFAHSTVSNSFPLAAAVNVRIVPNAVIVLDAPAPGTTISAGSIVGGWAADFAAPAGNGIDVVHVWAYPLGGGSPWFVGQAYMDVRRADVG